MNALNKMIDNAMKTCSPSNGEGLAKRLGVTRSAVSKWRSGSPINDDHLIALAALAHASKNDVLEVKQEIAGTAQARSFWRQLGAAAAVGVVALLPYSVIASDLEDSRNLTEGRSMHYAKLAKLARFLRSLLFRLKGTHDATAMLAAR